MQDYRDAIRQLLRPAERRHYKQLLAVCAVTAALQAISVLAVMPFVAMLLDPELADRHQVLVSVRDTLGLDSLQEMIVFSGCALLALLVLANGSIAFDVWLRLRFSFKLEHDMAERLLSVYLHQPYRDFLQRDTATLSKNVLSEVQRATVGTLLTGLQVFNDVMIVVFMGLILLWVDPIITISTLIVLGLSYTLIYGLLQGRIDRLGKRLPILEANILRHLSEALNAFREIRVARAERHFLQRFSRESRAAADNAVQYHLLEFLPILLLETLAFGLLIAVAIYAAANAENGMAEVIPVIALYGMAAYRLVPSIKEVFGGMAEIKYNRAAFLDLQKDFASARREQIAGCESSQIKSLRAALSQPGGFLELQSVSFAYQPGRPALHPLNLRLPLGSITCIAGASGSGKSTLMDLLLALIFPDSGSIRVGDFQLNTGNALAWRSQVAYVAQQVVLLEDTLSRNIAFGADDHEIDSERVRRAAAGAHIADYIESQLAEQYETVMARGGTRLSGGQQQRIGIARALYRDAPVIILDEASSALDLPTEAALMQTLRDLKGRTILFVSHKANVAANCDQVVIIDQGQLQAVGRFENLVAEDSPYRHLFEAAGSSEEGA